MISSPPVDDETTFINLRVAGEFPAALSGQYVVVGEAARVGERMLHVLTVAAGRAVSCRSHKVATDIVVAKVTAFGSKTLAFADGALAHELDTGSGTLRPVDLAGTRRRLVGGATIDRHTGELHMLTFDSLTPQLHVTVSRGALTRTIRSIDGAPSRIRQLELAGDEVVLLAHGFVGVAPRAGAIARPIWLQTDTGAGDIVGAYAHADTIIVCVTGPGLVRWTLDRRASRVHRELLDATPQKAVTTSWRHPGSAQRFLWTISSRAAHKHDLFTGQCRSHRFHDGRMPVGFVFAADRDRNSAEDGGWLIGLVDDRADGSELVVLDAEHIERSALATVQIPQRVRLGGSATWIPADCPASDA